VGQLGITSLSPIFAPQVAGKNKSRIFNDLKKSARGELSLASPLLNGKRISKSIKRKEKSP
jgi:hypothetical protein